MRLVLLTTLFVGVSLSAVPAANAQYGQQQYVGPAQADLAALTQSVQALEHHLRRMRAPQVDRAAHQFLEVLAHQSHNQAAVSQQYFELRRLFHARAIRNPAILDTWDLVVVHHNAFVENSHGHGGHGHHPQPQPQPQPYPPQGQALFSFDGAFERTPVRFSGRTVDEVFQQCTRFVGSARLNNVDDVTVNGRAFHNGPSFWRADALCSIAALNAASAFATVSGDVEGVPFAVGGQPGEAARVLRSYLPRATQGLQIDDYNIGGRAYHNGPGYWTGAQVAEMIIAQLPPGVQPMYQGRRQPRSQPGSQAAPPQQRRQPRRQPRRSRRQPR